MPDPFSKLLLKDYPVITERAVNWRDIDPALHVNNTKYLEWAETGRLDYFEKFFAKTGRKFTQDISPVIAAIHCKYLFPVTFPDRVLIGTRLLETGFYRYILEGLIVSVEHQRIVAKARAKMVLFDFSAQEKAPLPLGFAADSQTFEQEELEERARKRAANR